MVLLPELLYRRAFGQPLLAVPPAWAAAPRAVPMMGEDEGWSSITKLIPPPAAAPASEARSGLIGRLARRLPAPLRAVLKGARAGAAAWLGREDRSHRLDLTWQPSFHYARHWSRMPAFALPSYYDGRIRVNLRGRERDGMVEPSRYEETCRALEVMLRECRDPRTGEPAVLEVERTSSRDPLAVGNSDCDLLVVWRSSAAALEHPRLGLVGPVALRRTGGHTGPHGIAYIAAPGMATGDRGVRSAFDMAPTIADLLGCRPRIPLSGASLLAAS
jgi:hypothetical protein